MALYRLVWSTKARLEARTMLLYMVCLLITTVTGYGNYRLRIPHGDKVPDPCHPGKIWRGVGHTGVEGGGARNPFGLDFEKVGKLWTRLCRLDSDGDGKSNGEELGDPRCVWSPGSVPPKLKRAISHPGVCEPMDSPLCKEMNKWLDCNERNLNCSVFKDPDIRNITLKFQERVPVPSRETNYYCMIFDFPTDRDYHLVATQPVLDNKQLAHHILAFGCDTSAEIDVPPGPYPCAMLAHPQCLDIIGTWTVGSAGECVNNNTGFRLGKNGYRKAALQVHWNNPEKLSNLEDASGLRLYYTPNVRKNDAGMLVVGQDFIQLNPSLPETTVTVDSVCASKCTREMFDTPIYITSAINHMHYFGLSQIISQYRNGSKVRDITNDLIYSYDSPIINTFNSPIEILPGDELHTECVYKLPVTNPPICQGDGTQDEMCYGFITYYPAHRLIRPWCTTRKSIQSCQRHLPRYQNEAIDGCRWKEFLSKEINSAVLHVVVTCYHDDVLIDCSGQCLSALEKYRNHACLNGDIGSYVISKLRRDELGQQFLNAMDICDCSKDLGLGYCDRLIERALIGDQRKKYCTPEGKAISYKKYLPGNTAQVIVDDFNNGENSIQVIQCNIVVFIWIMFSGIFVV
ncbi:hypothetical protein LOTGIDRAFT_162200 [Lottia gigantea]|uniref:DOMON domain-containing protein n=1 Tax=Lottia gigantea TaxID=225164 RepID=V4AH59_LOTGI|nr:hypothetical protein LOTGIDRAFT_162200 [Lottia gigantea]ESO92726.1 hypothetical protein LOTGIDRAFT_162200 [Lottia gigantea]